jgi:hypothetical protein
MIGDTDAVITKVAARAIVHLATVRRAALDTRPADGSEITL